MKTKYTLQELIDGKFAIRCESQEEAGGWIYRYERLDCGAVAAVFVPNHNK